MKKRSMQHYDCTGFAGSSETGNKVLIHTSQLRDFYLFMWGLGEVSYTQNTDLHAQLLLVCWEPTIIISRFPDFFEFSYQFSHSVVSNSLWPHGLQHARTPCPSWTPGVYSDSPPLSRWCHPAISFSVVLFSCLQSFPASGSFQMSQLFESGGQRIGVSASTSVLSPAFLSRVIVK